MGRGEQKEKRTYTFRLSHSETARRHRDTGGGRETKTGKVGLVEAVLVEERLNGRLLLGRSVGDDEVLVGGEAEGTLVDLGDLAKSRLEGLSGLVGNATVLDEGGEVAPAVRSSLPSERVDVRSELEVALGLELVTETLLDLRLEVLDAHAVDGVLDTSVLAVHAVTVVALGGEDGLGDLETLVGRAETDDVGETGVSRLHRAMRGKEGQRKVEMEGEEEAERTE